MAVDELLKQYALGKRNFAWQDLRKADLSGAKLPGINLFRANLSEANLAQADLSQANLSKAILREANLKEANLTGSQLYKADLSGAKLDGINLTGADLSGIDLKGVNLGGAIVPDGRPYEQWLLSQHSEATIFAAIANNQPLSTLHESASESPIAVTSSPTGSSRVRFTAGQLYNLLPWHQLFLLWLGYFCFGQLLAIYEAPLFAWALAWAGSVIWAIDASLTGFVPITGAIALMSAVLMSEMSVAIAIAAATITLLLIGLLIFLDFGVKKALKDGLWIGLLVATAILVASWLFEVASWLFELVASSVFERSEELISSGVVVANTFYRALALLLGIVASTLGSFAWTSMDDVGFTLKQVLPTFAGVTWLGLCCGWAIGKLL